MEKQLGRKHLYLTYLRRRIPARKWPQSPLTFLGHLSLKNSPDTFIDLIIIKLNRRNSVGIQRTTHITELMRAKLEGADSTADERSHQIFTSEPSTSQFLKPDLKCLDKSMDFPQIVDPVLL